MSMFAQYTEPERVDGDNYNVQDHIDRPLIIQATEYRSNQVSRHTLPEGKPAVVLNVVDLTDGEVYNSVLWMGGAVVDGLKQYVGGQLLVIRLQWTTGKSGNNYATVQAGTASDVALAEQYIQAKGNPFAPQVSTPGPVPAQQQAPATAPAATPPWAAQQPAPAAAQAAPPF